MPTCDSIDLAFLENAPKVINADAYIGAARHRVFQAVACDPAGWGRWFPGFGNSGRWDTPQPYGVGSVRTVPAFGLRWRETILAWDENERWTFRLDYSTVRVFDALIEDYRFSDEGSGTRLKWTVAIRPGLAVRPIAPALPVGFRLLLTRAASRLERVLNSS